MKKLLTIILIALAFSVSAQYGDFNGNRGWDATWICVPGAGETDAGLYLFRKTIRLESLTEKFEIRVSADNRYKLYVNETLVSLGPALGDIQHWNYETVDIAPFLKQGVNIIAAKVWNEGDMKPVSQFSHKTGFIVQGTDDTSKTINTNDSWKCIEDKSYTPINQKVWGYYAAGAGEKIDMNLAIQKWQSPVFDDNTWKQAKAVFERSTRGMGFNTRGGWTLIPSIIPQMEMTKQRFESVRKTEGITVPESFPAEKTAFEIPANTTAKILFDQKFYTNAYPSLLFSGGKNSVIVFTYSEGLYDEKKAKNNRNEIEGKEIIGRQDTVISNGLTNQGFTSLNWRTYRYVELKVETKDSPLKIEDFYGTYTGYPFEMNAKLDTDDSELQKILEIGWRTARSCAVETYMDCPYYERLQYIGDARIQMMVSYYNSGDDRQAKNALNHWDNSRQKDGYTLSRYPDTQNQVIPTYSLWHVSTLYDYLMYGKDKDFLKSKLLGSRQIMNYFIGYLAKDGSLKNVPGWHFTDWVPQWMRGVAPFSEDGSSALMDFQMLLALQSAKTLEENVGSPEFAELYGKIAVQMQKTIQDKYWDESKKLFADTPEKDKFSQHCNSLAILAGMVDQTTANEIGKQMLSDTTLAPASIYFKYYLHLALTKAGLGSDYTKWLDIWRKNIDLGLTTWGEDSQVETTRSDCHAWGASPNIEFFRIILGIESAAPYFENVKIEPHLGAIKKISGEMPHPAGKISTEYNNSSEGLKAKIALPEGIAGTFIWNNKTYELKEGLNTINIESIQ
ncbi:alpha-L-rhamnosidase N-terminal domain-containing protein [uncultured Draconibacterium sp.]|uniref:alpha-L-rhamnosidase-related protein n=1 Tax=uncultured Draconibacterium sp. TaxID=1573823 RepID=UPI00321664C1